jgi:hypothetical protein
VPSAEPGAYSRFGSFRYRWLPAATEYQEDPVMRVISDKGCASGIIVKITAFYDENADGVLDEATDYIDSHEGRRDGRVTAGKAVRVPVTSNDAWLIGLDSDIVTVTSIRCAPAPWVRTYRGSGSDDRFITVRAAKTIRGRFTARATSTSGCITGVYFGDEPVDGFDLFYDGRRTLSRSANLSGVLGKGRNHMKVISSCPWTLTMTGTR